MLRSPASKGLFTLLGTLTFITSSHAQIPPDAGQSIREIESVPLQLPPRQRLEFDLPSVPAQQVEEGAARLTVKGIRLSGNRAIASDELQSLLAGLHGRSVALGELQAAANRLSSYYRERGYPLARAYLPAQEIENGIVEIAVLEGRYGEIRVNNASGLRDAVLAIPLAALQPGNVVRAQPLERGLLLLSDTPGVEVKSILAPGASVGTTDLLVDVLPGSRVSGSLSLDNYGNRFTGEYRLGGTLNLNSPLGLGDLLTLRAMGTDEQQQYYAAAYQLPVGPYATQLGGAWSEMDYRLAKDFSELDAHGNARIASLYLIQPLLRSRDFSLHARLQFDDKRLRDDIDLFDSESKKRSRVWSASLNGSVLDELSGGGINSFSLAWSHGSLTLDSAVDRLLDDLSAGSRGRFNKLNASVVRLQRLSERFSLYGELQGQWADGNLDSSEKLSLGGAHGVRAYPQGEASGDQGWLARLELRYALAPGWILNSFADHGELRLSKRPWSDGENHRSLSTAGVGAAWADQRWRINAAAAWKLGNAEPRSDVDRSPRAWVQVARYF